MWQEGGEGGVVNRVPFSETMTSHRWQTIGQSLFNRLQKQERKRGCEQKGEDGNACLARWEGRRKMNEDRKEIVLLIDKTFASKDKYIFKANVQIDTTLMSVC